MKSRLMVGFGLLLISGLGGAFVFGQELPERLTVTLDKPVHFLAPDGADTVLAPGEYTAKRHDDEKSMQLTAVASGETIVLQAEAGTHEEQLSVSTPVSVASDEDIVHIVLLMPGGTTLDAIGTLSGVRTRGPMFVPLPPQQLVGAMTMRQQRFGRTPVGGDVSGGGVIPGGGLVQEGGVILGGGLGVPQKETQLPFQTQPGLELQKAIIEKAGQKQITFGGAECSNVGPDGKFLTAEQWAAKYVGVGFAAKPTGPFSVELSWTGPPVQYEISGGVGYTYYADREENLTIQGSVGSQSPQKMAPGSRQQAPPGGQAFAAPGQPQTKTYTFRHERPGYSVVPGFQYQYLIKGTAPDGKIICQGASAKTLPPPQIVPLLSTFVPPNGIWLGFELPEYTDRLVVYQHPGRKQITSLQLESRSNRVRFELMPSSEGRLGITPAFQPQPSSVPYDLEVEAVWHHTPHTTNNTSVQARIPVAGPMPILLSGWVDLHTHPMSQLAFGGKVFHGAPDIGSRMSAVHVPKQGFDVDPRPVCLPDHRATNMEEALGIDSPTHGGVNQSRCGDETRRFVIAGMLEKLFGQLHAVGNRMGAPNFEHWPAWDDIAHQKMWVDWIERAHQGGLRVLVALSHNNRTLADVVSGHDPCKHAPITCVTDDMKSSILQIEEMKAFVSRHPDLMEVALTAADVYRIVQAKKIAIVLGVEIDNIGNFNMLPAGALQSVIVYNEIKRLYDTGVRYIFPIHIVDNTFGGTAIYNSEFNWANYRESQFPSHLAATKFPGSGNFWSLKCALPGEEIGFQARGGYNSDWGFTASIRVTRLGIPPDQYPPSYPSISANCTGHRNTKGLTGWGKFAIKEMMRLGMIIDIDHMSHLSVEETLSIAEGIPNGGYPLVSGHSSVRGWGGNTELARTRDQLARIGCLQGMFGLETDDGSDAHLWARHYLQALTAMAMPTNKCPNKTGLGAGRVAFGTDTNSLVHSPPRPMAGTYDTHRFISPHPTNPANPSIGISVLYNTAEFPMAMSQTGNKSWDYNDVGVAHYGMYPDFIQDVRTASLDPNRGMTMTGRDLVNGHLMRSAEYFYRMWQKIEAQKSYIPATCLQTGAPCL